MVLADRRGRQGCVTTRARARTVSLIAILTLLAVSSGCTAKRHTASQPSPSQRPASTSSSATVSPSQTALDRSTDGVFVPWLPIQLRSFTLADARIVNVARFKAEASCLRSFGLTFPDLPIAPLSQREIAFQQNRRYGITDPAEASQFGYHLDPSIAGGSGGTPLIEQLDDSQKTVLYNNAGLASFQGKPLAPGGCLGQATRSIAGNSEYAHSAIGATIDHDSFQQSMKNPRVIAAFVAWSQCMAGHGYHYPDPLAAGSDPRWTGPHVVDGEVTTALTDIGCKTSTNLVSTWSQVETELQTTMIAQDQAAVASNEAAFHAQMTRAQRILTSG